MKKLLLIAFICTATFSQAQLLDFGVKGGFNYPDFKLKENPEINDFSTTNGGGFHVGAMLRIKIPGLYIQPELLYTQVQTDFALSTTSMLDDQGKYITQRLDIPINVGLKLGPAAIFAGPVASFQLAEPNEIFDDSYKTATWGYQVGGGIKLRKFLIEVKYEGAFHSHAETAEIAGQSFELDARMHQVILSLGYFLGED